jgi:hypothetical protein
LSIGIRSSGICGNLRNLRIKVLPSSLAPLSELFHSVNNVPHYMEQQTFRHRRDNGRI